MSRGRREARTGRSYGGRDLEAEGRNWMGCRASVDHCDAGEALDRGSEGVRAAGDGGQ
jgi:hypothetical protein